MRITTSLRATVNTDKIKKLTVESAHRRIGQAAAMVEGEAKRLVSKGGGKDENRSAPDQPPFVQTGNLRSSIKFEFLRPLTALVGPSVIYGKWLEFGTRRMAARPFMRPGLFNVKNRLVTLFKDLF